MSSETTDAAEPSTPRPPKAGSVSDHFAWLRTRLAVESTLMSWVRTSTALIGFGFTIVQFFQRANAMEGVKAAVRPEASRYLGLMLIASGLLGLGLSIIQYRSMLRYLWSESFKEIAGTGGEPRTTPLLTVAVAVAVAGAFAFMAVVLRFL
jgi:putative membrane protein